MFCASGGCLFPVLCGPLRLRGQHQPEAAACAVGHGGDIPGKFPVCVPVKGLCAPETVSQPGQHPVRRQRGGQNFIRSRYARRPARIHHGP
ncbi:Uncharacterised protein [Citrobacter amalonaticus]|uniref:Uncharacterized protein n=1 Tax=Citrobacter amalonaticus TaxID=35703 RepID=A0A6N2T3I2_CITAM